MLKFKMISAWRALVIGLVFGLTVAPSAYSVDSFSIQTPDHTLGPPNIWPWGLEREFPWQVAQGVWQIHTEYGNQFYLFRPLQSNPNGEKSLEIILYDPVACRVLARGKGVESGRIVSAVMAGNKTGYYQMTIHAFDSSDLHSTETRRDSSNFSERMVLVMRIFAVGGHPNNYSNYLIERLATDPTEACRK